MMMGALTVLAAPSITTQPAGATLVAGNAFTLSVGASGTAPLIYKWYRDGKEISGATTERLQITNARFDSHNGDYVCAVSDATGTSTTAVARVVVNRAPWLNYPKSQYVQSGAGTGPIPFSISDPDTEADQLVLSVVNHSPALIPNDKIIIGGTGARRTISVTPSTNATGNADIELTISDGLSSHTEHLYVGIGSLVAPYAPTDNLKGASLVVGGNHTLTASAFGTLPFQFQWFKDEIALTSETSDTLLIDEVLPEDAGSYKCRISNAGGSATTNTAVITVRQPDALPAPAREAIPRGLATPIANAEYVIPVVITMWLPTTDGINLDVGKVPDYWSLNPMTVAAMKTKLINEAIQTKFMLEEGSRFRDYGRSNTRPSIGYKVIDILVFNQQVPAGRFSSTDGNGNKVYFADQERILATIGGSHYVNALGVREFWTYFGGLDSGFPCWDSSIHKTADLRTHQESNMSSALTGDESNSWQFDDLPLYRSTYVVYEYNIRRGAAENVHDHGHQLERMLPRASREEMGNDNVFWKDFAGFGLSGVFVPGRAGCTHYPPNAARDYDYHNQATVYSDIEDWRPDGLGALKLTTASTWGSLPYSWPTVSYSSMSSTEEAQWYMYWMQSMPGLGNRIPRHLGRMTNWWAQVADWDLCRRAGVGLWTTSAMPTWTAQPAGVAVDRGNALTLTCAVSAGPGDVVCYQWRHNGGIIPGATGPTYSIAAASDSDAGQYTVSAATPGGLIVSNEAVVSVGSPFSGVFFGSLSGGHGKWGVHLRSDNKGLLFACLSNPSALLKANIVLDDTGNFSVVGTPLLTTSDMAFSSGVAEGGLLAAAVGSGSVADLRGTINLQREATLSISMPDLSTLQGTANAEPLTGATQAYAGLYETTALGSGTGTTLLLVSSSGNTFIAMLTPSGTSSVIGTVANNGTLAATMDDGASLSGSIDSKGLLASLTQQGGPNGVLSFMGHSWEVASSSRLSNLSINTRIDSQASVTAGFIIKGPATKSLLVRGVGPTLDTLQVLGDDWQRDTRLMLNRMSTQEVIASNDDWGSAESNPSVWEANRNFTGLPFADGSKDAAIVGSLPYSDGGYTIEVKTPAHEARTAIAEIYELDTSSETRLSNLSANSMVTSAKRLTAGFVISGNATKRVLIRAVGPALSPWLPSTHLADPALSVFDVTAPSNIRQIASNDNWGTSGSNQNLATATTQSGAGLKLAEGSKDAAVVLTLAPGSYTAEMNTADDTSGIGLVEVYEVE